MVSSNYFNILMITFFFGPLCTLHTQKISMHGAMGFSQTQNVNVRLAYKANSNYRFNALMYSVGIRYMLNKNSLAELEVSKLTLGNKHAISSTPLASLAELNLFPVIPISTVAFSLSYVQEVLKTNKWNLKIGLGPCINIHDDDKIREGVVEDYNFFYNNKEYNIRYLIKRHTVETGTFGFKSLVNLNYLLTDRLELDLKPYYNFGLKAIAITTASLNYRTVSDSTVNFDSIINTISNGNFWGCQFSIRYFIDN